MLKRPLLFVCAALVVALSLSALIAHAEFGVNWSATYFNCPTQPPGATTIDINTCTVVTTQTGINGINFNWGAGSPLAGVNSDYFIVRFESVQTFQQGTYEFVASSDDGIRVYIDNVLVLDQFIGRTFTTDRFQQTLTAGPHSLRVEFLEIIDHAHPG